MGVYTYINAMLVGYFAFASVHYLCLWGLSRQERALLVFSIHCAVCAAVSLCLIGITTADTVAACQFALNARSTFGVLGIITTVWVVRLIAGLRADRFVLSVTVAAAGFALLNLCVLPINGTVTELRPLTFPWGEQIVVPLHDPHGWWLVPVYGLMISVAIYGLMSAWWLSRRDLGGGIIMAIAHSGGVLIIGVAFLIDFLHIQWPYVGVLPYAVWVALFALLMSREYRRRGAQLAASDRRFRAIFDHTFQFIGMLSTDGRLLEANRTALEFAEVQEADVLGKPFWECPWWTHSPELQKRLQAAIAVAAGGEMVRFEVTHPGADGELHQVDFSLKPIRDEYGRVVYLIPEGRDITQIKNAEDALLASEARSRAILQALPDLMFRLNAAGEIIDYHASQQDDLYVAPADFMGKRIAGVLPGEVGQLFQNHLQAALETREHQQFEYDLTLPNRKLATFEARMVLCGNSETITIIRNISEKNRLAEQLRQARKMDAIGQMAGGIAHDFNNMLTVINGQAALMLSTLPDEHPLRFGLQLIHKAGERSAAMTKQLLTFSRRTPREIKTIDVNHHILGAEMMLRRLIGENLGWRLNLEEELDCIQSDPSQIDQVLINLVLNARDSMPEGGEVTIATQNLRMDPHSIPVPNVAPGNYVALTVTDTGCGMSEEVQEHIFEPFFTTKEFGKGTGLGLSVVHGIVQACGGYVQVTSKPGAGSTFQVCFRACEARPDMPAATDATAVPSQPSGETVLLVEDEQGVREIAQVALQSGGYRVLSASDAHEAIAIANNHPHPIDLLLSDVVMPGLSGRALADILCETRREMKVLFMSGYMGDTTRRHEVLQGDVNFIAKPFTFATILAKVRQLLDEPQPSSSRKEHVVRA